MASSHRSLSPLQAQPSHRSWEAEPLAQQCIWEGRGWNDAPLHWEALPWEAHSCPWGWEGSKQDTRNSPLGSPCRWLSLSSSSLGPSCYGTIISSISSCLSSEESPGREDSSPPPLPLSSPPLTPLSSGQHNSLSPYPRHWKSWLHFCLSGCWNS